MSELVEIPFGDNPGDTAVLLLAAAVGLGLEPHVVATTSEATFVVPAEVNSKAFPPKKSTKVKE